MAISCWKDMGSPKLVSSNTLLAAFNGRYFCPHCILPPFDIELAEKVVSVEVEVVVFGYTGYSQKTEHLEQPLHTNRSQINTSMFVM